MKRYIGYFLLITVLLMKLIELHSGLHAPNIDMNRMDMLISIGSLMLLSFWSLWLPRRGRIIALITLDVLLTGLIYADILYYRYFQDFITIPVLFQAGQMDALGDSVLALIRPGDLWLFADWLILLCYGIIRFIKQRRNAVSQLSIPAGPYQGKSPSSSYRLSRTRGDLSLRWLRKAGPGAAALLLGMVLTFGPIHSYATTWARDLFTGNWWSLAMYNVTGLIGFHAYDAYQYSKEHLGPQPSLPAEEKASMEQWFDQHRSEQAERNDTFGKYKGSNIIIVQAEAFMNFMVGRSVNGQEITPNLNALLKDNLYFSNYYHQTSQGRTSDADFTSNGSLYPLVSGSVFVRYPDHQFNVLPAILKDKGYSTNAFHAYESSFWNRKLMYTAMGYDTFYSKKNFIMDEPLGWSLGDKSFFRQSLSVMDGLKPPFHAFLTTLSSHYPYSLPEPVQSLDTGEYDGTIFGDYLSAIHYTDEAVGQLVDGLKEKGLWDNSIFVFYGDHDNSITDIAYYEQFLGKSLSAYEMHEIMNQVPLLIHLPGETAGFKDDMPAGQLDLTPSLLHLLGITDGYYHMGNNLFSGKQRLVTLRTGSFSDSELTYIPDQNGQFESGVCYSRDDGLPVETKQCLSGYEESLKRLQISDDIMKYDALRKLK
ncbi:LTA synthase family protein [Paenibacillus sp. sgz500958]|uniref:LTA synthase family protein n=1 Tax=Paenibacillus sp. sgz500958 TaxID=3242475 RepID=UPI0036D34173